MPKELEVNVQDDDPKILTYAKVEHGETVASINIVNPTQELREIFFAFIDACAKRRA